MSNKKERINDKTLCAEYEAVYHYTLSLCRDEPLAQDITQEAFLKAMKYSDKFNGDSYICADYPDKTIKWNLKGEVIEEVIKNKDK